MFTLCAMSVSYSEHSQGKFPVLYSIRVNSTFNRACLLRLGLRMTPQRTVREGKYR